MSQKISELTDKQVISAGMRLLGMRTSKRKARSSRKNGRLAWSKKRKICKLCGGSCNNSAKVLTCQNCRHEQRKAKAKNNSK